jgi:lipopolysaccharide transport system ATP-binding protein
MHDAIVNIERLGKRYRLSHQAAEPYVALRDVLASALSAPGRWLRRARRNAAAGSEDFWALKDVTFTVARGEVVGIVGRNGAGKSTLLKILSRITEPTTGRVTLDGRVASLLEVGTGFHPELSGRENIFLNGAILGMSRAEIARKFDDIVAFADVERFLDTPVKRYSSGMYVRLAFAVAAHLEPEILIVDEVLAVGDAEFQKRCLGKMREVSRGGRTVLFVSHNMSAVQTLCTSAVWLQDGSVAARGPVAETVSQYLAATQDVMPDRTRSVRIGDGLELRRIELSPNPVESGGAVKFSLTFAAEIATKINELALLVFSSLEARVAVIDLRSAGLPVTVSPGRDWSVSGRITSLPVVEGDYRLGIYLATGDFMGNLLDLAQLRVNGRVQPGGHVPYPVEYRGMVELDFQINA